MDAHEPLMSESLKTLLVDHRLEFEACFSKAYADFLKKASSGTAQLVVLAFTEHDSAASDPMVFGPQNAAEAITAAVGSAIDRYIERVEDSMRNDPRLLFIVSNGFQQGYSPATKEIILYDYGWSSQKNAP